MSYCKWMLHTSAFMLKVILLLLQFQIHLLIMKHCKVKLFITDI